jgi:hypothetical protein
METWDVYSNGLESGAREGIWRERFYIETTERDKYRKDYQRKKTGGEFSKLHGQWVLQNVLKSTVWYINTRNIFFVFVPKSSSLTEISYFENLVALEW